MTYTYKFIPSGASIQLSPKDEYKELFQQNITDSFYAASNVYTITEETALASGIYQNVDVRISQVVDAGVGDRVTDDFQLLLFSDIQHSVDLGRMYFFSDNYWITTNIDKLKTLAVSATVRRCNNTLRWMDSNGAIYTVPCVINYLIKQNRDYSTAGSAMVTPAGMAEIIVQKNAMSNKIIANQRFLFGNADNWTAWRVEGGGIGNFNNLTTLDNTSVGLIRLSMQVDYVNPQNDDITNGIADVTENVYTLTLNQSTISGNAGQTVQLLGTVTLNTQIVTRTLTWSSNHTNIATVSTTGLVTFIAVGTATITCQLSENTSVTDTCGVTVGSTPVDNYQLVFSPNQNYVLENREVTWTVYLFKNGTQQADVMTFSLDANTVPSTRYVYTVLGANSFKIHNYGMFLTDTLDITVTTGSYTDLISISLRGAW